MYDSAQEYHKKWLKTEAGRIYKAKNDRYKRSALSMMQLEFIESELERISEECYEYECSILEDDTLIDALDGETEDLYEYRFMFTDLAARCDSLGDALRSANVSRHFDDFFVGIIGNKFEIVGYDGFEEDYFSLTGYETEWAQNESAKRLMKLTKENLLSVCGQCFGIAVSVLDIRHTFECLTSALDLLKGSRTALLANIQNIETAYAAAEQHNFRTYGHGSEATQHFNDLLWRLPDKVWVG